MCCILQPKISDPSKSLMTLQESASKSTFSDWRAPINNLTGNIQTAVHCTATATLTVTMEDQTRGVKQINFFLGCVLGWQIFAPYALISVLTMVLTMVL